MSFARLKTLLRCFQNGPGRNMTPRHRSNLNSLNTRPLLTSANNFSQKTPEDEDVNKPLVYTKSKAAAMSVDVSFGSKHKRPLKKVLPISIIGIGLLMWVFTREETDIDRILSADLKDNMPGLFENNEAKDVPLQEGQAEEGAVDGTR